METGIRKATKMDIPQLIELYYELSSSENSIDLNEAITAYEKAISSGVTYFVADIGGKIVGSCYIALIPNITRQCRPIGFVENVVVDSDYRRRGVGRKLMNAATEYAKEQNCYKVTLQSGVKREEAHKFYESVGFDGNSKRAFEIRF